jgi:sugar/nucleoside kinase (ribokinase family)
LSEWKPDAGQRVRGLGRPHLVTVGDLMMDTVISVGPEACARLGAAPGTAVFRVEAEVEEALAELGGGPATAGGSAANTSVAFCASGGHASVLATWPGDDVTRMIRDDLRNRGVRLPLPPSPGGRVGKCVVLLLPGGERAFLIWQGEPQRLQVLRDAVDTWFAGGPSCNGVLAEGYMLATAAGDEVVRLAMARARERRVARILSLSDQRLVAENRQRFQAVLAGWVDVVIGNEAEFMALSGTSSAGDVAAEYSRRGVLAVVTMGNRGAMVHASEGRWEIEAKAAAPTSTVGAGDAFAGGFLFGMLAGLPHATCLALGRDKANSVLRVSQARLPLD